MIIIFDALKDNLNGFLKQNALWIALGLVGVIIIVIGIILLVNLKKKPKKPEIAEKSLWVEALGGNENIITSEASGSRLVVKLVDKSKIDREKLASLGVTSVIEMSDKLTLLLEDKAELVKQELDK